MIIFNTSYNVEKSIEKEWLFWMKNTFIPLLMDTDIFIKNYFCKVMVDDEKTYSLQLFLKNMERYNKYQNEYANKFNAILKSKFANDVLSFSTLLEEV